MPRPKYSHEANCRYHDEDAVRGEKAVATTKCRAIKRAGCSSKQGKKQRDRALGPITARPSIDGTSLHIRTWSQTTQQLTEKEKLDRVRSGCVEGGEEQIHRAATEIKKMSSRQSAEAIS
jgi:hypothetical protein